jgi:hypothetical protein
MYVSNGTKLSEQPLTINDGIPSKPVAFGLFQTTGHILIIERLAGHIHILVYIILIF